MRNNRVVTGNLICQNEEKGTYVFLRVGTVYVFLDEINSIGDLIKVRFNKLQIQSFDTDERKSFHIDNESLSPYYEKKKFKTLRKIKRDYLFDVRSKAGIQY